MYFLQTWGEQSIRQKQTNRKILYLLTRLLKNDERMNIYHFISVLKNFVLGSLKAYYYY